MKPIEIIEHCREKGIVLQAEGHHLRFNAPVGVLSADLRQLLAENKEAILELLQTHDDYSSLSIPERKSHLARSPIPLSFAQQRLWFLHQWEPESSAYHLPYAWRFHGPLNCSALEGSLHDMVTRHESLRTTFTVVEGQPVQVIAPSGQPPLSIVDMSEVPESDREVEVKRLIHERASQPFDLNTGPLLRTTLIPLGKENHIFLVTLHHIITDGWSMGIFWRELTTLYKSYVTDQPVSLPALPIQYADFAVWQRQWLQGDVVEQQLSYWRTQLVEVPPTLDLPTDAPHPPQQSYRGTRKFFSLTPSLTQKLKRLGQEEGVTLFMTLLASFQVLLGRYTGQRDILVGSPIAGRTRTELEGLIGFFVNTLVLRTRFRGHPTFREVLRQVRKTCLAAYRHQDLPFEKLVEALQPVRDPSRHPIFQVMFQLFQREHTAGLTLPTLQVELIRRSIQTAKFDLELSLVATSETIEGNLIFNTDLFSDVTMTHFVTHFQTLLEELVAAPEQPVMQVALLTQAERQQLLVDWNATQTAYPREATIAELFEAQVSQTPDALAVVFEGESLTYHQLNTRANQLAHTLRKHGVGPEVCVGLCLDRSVEMVVGIVGILKAGGAYVPLDPGAPPSRLAMLLQDADIAVLLTRSHLRATFPEFSGTILILDTGWTTSPQAPMTNLPSNSTADHLAYVIYTSGSTGVPKGISIPQRAVLRLVLETNYVDLTASDRVAQTSTISFDAATFELWGALLHGAQLVIISKDIALAPHDFAAHLEHHGITTMFLTTALFNQMAREAPQAFRGVRHLLFGGEAVDPRWVREILQTAPPERLLHVYGPTESTTFTTWHFTEAVAPEEMTVPIGQPIANTQVYVLDRTLQPVPVGVYGELYIGGEGLARNYLQRPALTAEQFVPHPFSEVPGARLYKTGDVVRYRPDGALEFKGRWDHQVKVRGYRIELGEIEAVVAQHPMVAESVAVVREDEPGVKRVVAYVVPADASLSSSALRRHLKHILPEYMVPAVFVMLDALPLTPNGKVDRRALPAPAGTRPELEAPFQEPHPGVEQTLADIWQQLLRVDQVGRHDNFFELGGDSILSIQLVARANQAGLRVTPQQIFHHQTIAALAPEVGTHAEVLAEQGVVTGALPLTPIQHWFFEHQVEEPHHFNMVWVLEAQTLLDPGQLEQVVKALVVHHDALRLRVTSQDTGWQQELRVPDGHSPFVYYKWSHLSPAEAEQAWHREVAHLQASLSLADGPMLRVALVHFGPGQPDRVLLVIHHLAVDGISWRILLEDLQTAYAQLQKGQPIQLPPKTTSFKQWAESLVAYAQSEALEQELSYWQEVASTPCTPLPRDVADGVNSVASTRTVTVALTRDETQALLQEIPEVYHTHINDVLLTALVDALAEWTKHNAVLINLEGHGREELFDGIDLSRTVGWFTSIFPVVLKRAHPEHPGECLKAVKEQLRQIPHRGMGYGLLRYVTHDTALQAHLGEPRPPEISFNYLGQFDQVLPGSAVFTRSKTSGGPTRSPRGHRSHLVEINGQINGGILQMHWSYSEHVHRCATIEALAQHYLAALRALIVHCQSPEAGGYTPSDFPLAQVSQPHLDTILTQVQGGSGRAELADLYPLTPLQQGLWFHTLAAPESGIYFEQSVSRLEGEVDTNVLRRAWEAVMARHGIFRTSLVWEGLDHPLQLVHPTVVLPWEQEDWRGSAVREDPARLRRFLEADRARGFDFARAPLMHLTLIQVAESTAIVVWSFHHLLLDRWSCEVVEKEVWAAYEALREGQAVPGEAPRPFREYLGWLQGQDLAEAEREWRHTLKGFAAPTVLGVDEGPAPSGHQSGHYDAQQLTLSEPATADLDRLAREHQVTLNTLVQGAWAVVLSRYSGMEDVVFGATVSGRSAGLRGMEAMVGLFINTLPVRVHVDPSQSVAVWLREVQAQQVAMRQYEYAPLFEIQKWSEVPNGVPLFNTLVVFENTPGDGAATGGASGLTVKGVSSGRGGQTNYPLTVVALPGRMLHLGITYDTEHYAAAAICRVLGHVQQVLAEMVAEPEESLGTISLVTEAERQQLLVEWNETKKAYPREATIAELFEAQVAQTPEAVALVFEDQQLTYAELNARANQLAHYLQRQGVGPEVCVGLCIERSLEMVVGILGILKAGGAYVPLDPAYPQERVAYMIEDAQIQVLLTYGGLAVELSKHGMPAVCLDPSQPHLTSENGANPVCQVSERNLAYIIYTSGSTGRPKGVAIEHRSTVALLQWAKEVFGEEDLLGVLASTSICFDLSVFELFVPLSWGGTVTLADNVLALPELSNRDGVTLINTVPSAMAELVRGTQLPPSVRTVNLAGEPLRPHLVKQIHKRSMVQKVHDLYGPSEDTTYSTIALRHSEGPETIGRPIVNTQVYLLDRYGQPVPVGVAGELHLGGLGMARGYINRPDVTAEKFVPHPFRGSSGLRLYQTGDRARYKSDGNVEFLGRVDHQVKIRGFRIELGEIEVVLGHHPAVQEAVVVAREDEAGEKRLVGYVVSNHEPAPAVEDLCNFIKTQLPDYMVPSHFVMLDALPLTHNGKVDRRALPIPDGSRGNLATAFVPPRTPTEQALVGIWQAVLGVEQIGIHDNFFNLGGHSLLATQAISRVRDTFHVELPLRRLFEDPTIDCLAGVIETARGGGQTLASQPLVQCSRIDWLPLSFAQQRLWFLHQLEPESPAYNMPLALRLQGPLEVEALHQSLQALVDRHETLRTCFPDVDGEPSQVIADSTELSWGQHDLRAVPELDREAAGQELIGQLAMQPFDLATGPVIRTSLLQLSDEDHVLLVTLHHIISDGWSLGVISRELAALYDALVHHQPSPLPPLPIQYVDFSHWQRQWFMREVLDQQLTYWRDHLADLARLEMPTDHPRPPIQTYSGAKHTLALPTSLRDQLQALSRQEGVTLAITLLAAFQVLLARYTGQTDIVVGSPIANRNRREIEGLIGFFVNSLVMRTDLSGDPPFHEVLKRVQEVSLVAYDHQDLPFERLVEELQPERDPSRNPLFQVSFAVQNAPFTGFTLPGLTVHPFGSGANTTRFDLECHIWERSGGFAAVWYYNTALFEAATVARLGQHFKTVLEGVVQHPEVPLSQLPILSERETRQQLVEWNATEQDVPTEPCLHELIEAQGSRTPEAVAVVCGETDVTYDELNRQANQLAQYLRQHGVGPDTLVGVCMERSVDLVISLLGILKAGGAYVPFDPSYPKERLAFMVQDAQLGVLLTHQAVRANLSMGDVTVVCLDTDWPIITKQVTTSSYNGVSSDNLAYVLYTSGSTGTPKGVMIPHRGVVNYLSWATQAYEMVQGDGAPVYSSLGFDFTITSLFGPLVVGQRVILLPEETRAEELGELLHSATDLSVLKLTPAHLEVMRPRLSQGDFKGRPRFLIIGGEALLSEHLAVWRDQFPTTRVINEYGPTEGVVGCCIFEVPATGPLVGPVLIGRPSVNTQLYVLDRAGQPVPVGVRGELYIGGRQVARGYLGRSDLTAERFVPHPFSAELGARLYRTGDGVRYRVDGTLEFLGRLDDQVKIRGYRVELGEVDTLLLQHPAVTESVSLVREDVPGDKRLVAYVVPNPDQVETLRQTEGSDWAEQHITNWQTLYEETYGEISPSRNPTFNITGWNSSYTGDPIPPEEMRQWVEATVERIGVLQPKRVLEIGCGTGLLLYQLAPTCAQYVATDFSKKVLAQLQQGLQARPDLAHVSLSHCLADDFRGIAPGSFDTVILNSVAQYFPSMDYLVRVLEGAVQAVKPGGHIFVGDIRSLPLLTAFHTSVRLHQANDSLSTKDLVRQIQQAQAREEELVIDPTFFTALAEEVPRIGNVEILLKHGRMHNELTRFRYDVILHVELPTQSVEHDHWVDWQAEQLSLTGLQHLLTDQQPEVLGIRGIPNARMVESLKMVEVLAAGSGPSTAEALREMVQGADSEGIDPQTFWDAVAKLPYWCELSPGSERGKGRMTAVLRRHEPGKRRPPVGLPVLTAGRPLQPWHTYGSNPLHGKLVKAVVPQLRAYLQAQVPEYMVPSAFVVVDVLPLTPNGKVDRRALPAPEGTRANLETGFVAPRTPTEQTLAGIWQEVLGVEQVGIHDNFFDLGGHSLLATQVMSRLREACQVEVPLRTLFEVPTIAGLARVIENSNLERTSQSITPIKKATSHFSDVDQYSDEEVDSLLRDLLSDQEVQE